MREVVDGLGKVIDDALEAKGLNDPLTAMLFTGASVADAGEEAERTARPATTARSQTARRPVRPRSSPSNRRTSVMTSTDRFTSHSVAGSASSRS